MSASCNQFQQFALVAGLAVLVGGSSLNLAKEGSAYQSSTDAGHNPSYAVDGKSRDSEFSKTAKDSDPWWAVDLGVSRAVGTVQIFIAERAHGGGLHDVNVGVTDSSPMDTTPSISGPSYTLCTKHQGHVISGDVITLRCDNGTISGRYVIIQVDSTTSPGGTDHLALSEVNVYQDIACRAGYEIAGDTWCVKSVLDYQRSWQSAKQYCADDGGRLLQIESRAEAGVVNDYLRSSNDYSVSENLARGRPATAKDHHITSVHPAGTLVAPKAVDGLYAVVTDMYHSAGTVNPWWAVDLGTRAPVALVWLLNFIFKTGNGVHFRAFDVGVTDTSPWSTAPTAGSYELCYHQVGGFPLHKFIHCTPPVTGRYVIIYGTAASADYIRLTEIEIHAIAGVNTATNLALGRPAVQKSTFTNADLPLAGKATNGDLSVEYLIDGCSHTLPDTDPWWAVDLGSSQTVAGVLLLNRLDCAACPDRLHNFYVGVTDTSPWITAPSSGAYSLCYHYPGVARMTSLLKCQGGPITGQYVIVQILGGPSEILTLCEIEVYPPLAGSSKMWTGAATDGDQFYWSTNNQTLQSWLSGQPDHSPTTDARVALDLSLNVSNGNLVDEPLTELLYFACEAVLSSSEVSARGSLHSSVGGMGGGTTILD